MDTEIKIETDALAQSAIKINGLSLTEDAMDVLHVLQDTKPGNIGDFYLRMLQEIIDLMLVSPDLECDMEQVRCLTMIKQDIRALHLGERMDMTE